MLKFNASIVGCELPIGFGVVGVALSFPCCDLGFQSMFVGDTAIETLG